VTVFPFARDRADDNALRDVTKLSPRVIKPDDIQRQFWFLAWLFAFSRNAKIQRAVAG
jgi:hypothetical protein